MLLGLPVLMSNFTFCLVVAVAGVDPAKPLQITVLPDGETDVFFMFFLILQPYLMEPNKADLSNGLGKGFFPLQIKKTNKTLTL